MMREVPVSAIAWQPPLHSGTSGTATLIQKNGRIKEAQSGENMPVHWELPVCLLTQ